MSQPDVVRSPSEWKRYRITLPPMFSEVSAPNMEEAITVGILAIKGSLNPDDQAVRKFSTVEEI